MSPEPTRMTGTGANTRGLAHLARLGQLVREEASVEDVLGYAGFPAHDLPDGYVFTQPVRFSP